MIVTRRSSTSLAVTLALVVVGAGCGPDITDTGGDGPPRGAVARFDPGAGDLPFPHALLLLGSTDGTVALEGDPRDPSDPVHALSALEGFSSTSPITLSFSGPLDPRSIVPGRTVRVFEVALGPALTVTAAGDELPPGARYVTALTDDDATLVVVPTAPLPAGAGVLVVVTTGVRDAHMLPAEPSTTFRVARAAAPLVDEHGRSTRRYLSDDDARALEPLRRIVSSMAAAAEAHGIARDTLVVATAFPTLPASPVPARVQHEIDDAVARDARADALLVHPAPLFTTAALNEEGAPPRFMGTAAVYAAALRLPRYLDDADPRGATMRTTSGRSPTTRDALPVVVDEALVPVLVTVPVAPDAVRPFPVVVFQHGITGDRTQALAVAEACAAAGLAVVALDLPVHGLPDDDDAHPLAALLPLLAASSATSVYATAPAFLGRDVRERLPAVDLVENATLAPGADGRVDGSGAHFADLSRLLAVRDKLVHAVLDHQWLASALAAGVDLDDDGAPDLAPGRATFLGHSLGAMVGSALSSTTTPYRAYALANPGGRLASVFARSPTFGPRVEAALAARGVEAGSPGFARFVTVAQTVLDGVDPVALASPYGPPLLVALALGDGDTPPDQVVPPRLDGDPLGGGLPLAGAHGLVPVVDGSYTAPDGARVLVPFSRGDHASLLDPTASPDATRELQRVVVGFLASGGAQVVITDDTVISDEAPTPGARAP